MISIKRFLDQRHTKDAGGNRDETEALKQVGHLLLEGIAAHSVPGRAADFNVLRQSLENLALQIDKPESPLSLLSSTSEAVEVLESYCQQTTAFFREQKELMQGMVSMLTETLVHVSGQSDACAIRLQTIEKELEIAAGLSDLKAVRAGMENCLRALRDAAAQQRNNSTAAAAKLQSHVDQIHRASLDPPHPPLTTADIRQLAEVEEPPMVSALQTYVAGFKLRRAEHIAGRFGETAARQMLSTLGAQLREVVGPDDRLLRWKGTSYLLFHNSTATIGEVRTLLSETVAKVGMQHVEVGRKSALLSVGVDWIVFRQADHASLEAVLAEVDKFLEGPAPEKPAVALQPH